MLYIIYCLVNKRYYLGYSSYEACERSSPLGRQIERLNNNLAPKTMIALQRDWNKFGSHKFKWWVLEYTNDPYALDELLEFSSRNRYNILLAPPAPAKRIRGYIHQKKVLSNDVIKRIWDSLHLDIFVSVSDLAVIFDTTPSIISRIASKQLGSDIHKHKRKPLMSVRNESS